MRRINTFLVPLALAVGGLAACGADESAPAPSSSAAVAAPTTAAEISTPAAEASTPAAEASTAADAALSGNSNDTSAGAKPWQAPDASAKCKLMGRYSEQLDKISPADSMSDPAEFKKLVPELEEMKKIAEEVRAAGMPEPLAGKFVEMNTAMLKLAEAGDLQSFQSGSFLEEEMGKAIDELGTWCN